MFADQNTNISKIKRIIAHRKINIFSSLNKELISLIHKDLPQIVREKPNNLIETKATMTQLTEKMMFTFTQNKSAAN